MNRQSAALAQISGFRDYVSELAQDPLGPQALAKGVPPPSIRKHQNPHSPILMKFYDRTYGNHRRLRLEPVVCVSKSDDVPTRATPAALCTDQGDTRVPRVAASPAALCTDQGDKATHAIRRVEC